MSKNVLLRLLCVLFFAAVLVSSVPARADIEDWMPDSDKWGGEQSKGFLGRIVDVFKKFYDGFNEIKDKIIEFFKQQIDNFCNWILDYVFYFGGILLEKLLYFLDWLLQTGWSLFVWLMECLPVVVLPSGFERGMEYFIGYAALLNRIIPITETLLWIGFYISALLTVTAYRIIKSWIPVVAT